ncbi:MAG: DMT family transporter [Pseudomonadota bacterium]
MSPIRPASLNIEYGLLGLLAVLWGASYLLIKVAVAEIPPVTLIAARVAIAAGCLFALMVWNGQRLPRDQRTWRMLFIQAVFNSIAAWTILAWGQQYVDSGLASVLNSTSPIFVFLITVAVTRHEATSFVKLFGVCLGLTGVVLIVGPSVLAGLGQHVAGQVASVLGAVLYACAAIYGKRFSDLPAPVTAAGTMVCATACLVPASLIIDRPWHLTPSITALAAAAALGVFCTGLALMIYFRLVRTLGSIGVASQAYLRAGVGVVLGMVVLGEQISLAVGIGLVCALVGVAAMNAPSHAKPAAPPSPR